MIALLWLVWAILASPFKSKCRLELENATLRHQVMVLRRQARGRIRLTDLDRLFLPLCAKSSHPAIQRHLEAPQAHPLISSNTRAGMPRQFVRCTNACESRTRHGW